MSRIQNPADWRTVHDWARAELRSIEGLVRTVTLSPEGCDAIARIRTELLAMLGDASIAREREEAAKGGTSL